MELFEETYNLTIEEIDGKNKTERKLTINVGAVFDSAGILHIDQLKELYDQGEKQMSAAPANHVPEKKEDALKKKKKHK